MNRLPLRALYLGNDPLHCSLVEFHLAKAGFLVSVASTVKEAFDLAYKTAYQLVVADYHLAQSDGIALARQLRRIDGYDSNPFVLLVQREDALDLDHMHKELQMLVIRVSGNLAKVIDKIAESCRQAAMQAGESTVVRR